VRATVPDRPGVLEQLAHGFAGRELNVLDVHVHTLGDAVLDEFVLAAPRDVDAGAIAGVVGRAGGRDVQVRRTTATAPGGSPLRDVVAGRATGQERIESRRPDRGAAPCLPPGPRWTSSAS
jgi:hypothetical protein